MADKGVAGKGGAGRQVVFYGLSTCVWCKKTRELLEGLGVEFELVYVDKLDGEERREALARVRRWNPSGTFPTVVVDDAQSVAGYRPDDIKKLLGL